MKPTHIGKLAGQDEPVKLYQSQNFWSDGKHKWRKETGEPAGKSKALKLDLNSIVRLPTHIYLTKDGHKYEVVHSDSKKDLMTLRNADGMCFETHISKAVGYEITKTYT